MKFQFTSAFGLLLLNASASSFGANNPKKIGARRGSSAATVASGRIPFVSGGAVTGGAFGTKLGSSVESAATSMEAAVTSENLELLSERGRKAILALIEHDVDGFQEHVYGDWPEAGSEDEGKKLLAEQVSRKASVRNFFATSGKPLVSSGTKRDC